MSTPPSESIWEYSSSILLSEKHISVDPISLRQEISPSPPQYDHHTKTNKLKMFSCSLPKSPAKQKKKFVSNMKTSEGLDRQHSVALSNLERLRESQLQRSKSCGERRACQPSIDFDFCSSTTATATTISITKMVEREEKEVLEISHKKGGGGGEDARPSVSYYEQKFKCCLFLPGFGKSPKTVRPRKQEEEEELEPDSIGIVSQRVSLEKFECGSWRSSAIINSEDQDGDATSNLFFDLPVELIRCSTVNDTESPVTTAFLFDSHKDQDQHHPHTKGVLKNTTTITTTAQHRKSHDSSNSSRQVRFSTSSPTSPTSSCITPRLRKARDEFNAFLEAQST